jgi:hypothetical protein
VKTGQAAFRLLPLHQNKSFKTNVATEIFWLWSEADKNVLEKTPKEMLPEDKNIRTSTVYEAEQASLKRQNRESYN